MTAPNPFADDGPVFRVRDDETVVEVTGDDAGTWLQGQLTNDVRRATPGNGVYSLVVDVKGKIVGDLWVFPEQDGRFLCAVGDDHVDAVLERLDAYIIMEDVELTRRPDLAVVTVLGSTPHGGGAVPDAGVPRTYRTERLPGRPGVDLVVPRDDLGSVTAKLRDAARELDDDAWETRRLAHGAPRFGVDFDHRHFPQEAGLRDRAVSFDKGCYLGQEVVCMLEMRGKLKRRLGRVRGAGGAAATPGAEVTGPDGQVVGVLGSGARQPSGDLVAFAMLPTALAAPGTRVQVGESDLEVLD